MTTGGFLIWDFDGTLAFRPGNWTGALCEIIALHRPDLGMTPNRLRPYLQRGFPWHAPEVVRKPCSPEQWWSELFSVLTLAVQSAAGLDEPEAQRLVEGIRAAYTDAKHWRVFDDVKPALAMLRVRG